MGVNSIAEYLEGLNEEGKQYVCAFISFMGNVYPELTHKISFSIPMWLLGKKMNDGYIGVSAAKQHVSIHFSDEAFVEGLAEKLPSCKRGKRCINVKYGDDKSFEAVKESVSEFMHKAEETGKMR